MQATSVTQLCNLQGGPKISIHSEIDHFFNKLPLYSPNMFYMVTIILKTHTDAFLPRMMYSAANRRVVFWGFLENAASTTSVVPSSCIFVDDHFSVCQQHFQAF
jgi:long-subunit acyl-CoA synthetase (AMP-forming)